MHVAMTSLQRVLGLLWASKDRAQGMAILHNEMHDGDESEMMPASDAACAGGLVVPGQLFTLPRQRDTVETPDRRPFGSSMTQIQKNQNPESIVPGAISTLTCSWPLVDQSTQAMWGVRCACVATSALAMVDGQRGECDKLESDCALKPERVRDVGVVT